MDQDQVINYLKLLNVIILSNWTLVTIFYIIFFYKSCYNLVMPFQLAKYVMCSGICIEYWYLCSFFVYDYGPTIVFVLWTFGDGCKKLVPLGVGDRNDIQNCGQETSNVPLPYPVAISKWKQYNNNMTSCSMDCRVGLWFENW